MICKCKEKRILGGNMKKFILGSLVISTSLLAAPYGTMIPAPTPQTYETKTDASIKDRFTSTEDHKLGSQIRVQMAEIIGAPKAEAIILTIDAGDVKLIGLVPSEEAKRKIMESIHQIKGVKSVHNKLEIEKNGKR